MVFLWAASSGNVLSDTSVRPAKIQISLRIRAVWSESSLDAFWIAKDAKFLHVHNEDTDQTVRMHRLILDFVGCTCQKVRFLTLRTQMYLFISNAILFFFFFLFFIFYFLVNLVTKDPNGVWNVLSYSLDLWSRHYGWFKRSLSVVLKHGRNVSFRLVVQCILD